MLTFSAVCNTIFIGGCITMSFKITKKETENSLSALLSEFNATIEKGKFQEAIAREHCIRILKKHAIEKISLIN